MCSEYPALMRCRGWHVEQYVLSGEAFRLSKIALQLWHRTRSPRPKYAVVAVQSFKFFWVVSPMASHLAYVKTPPGFARRPITNP